MKKYHLGIFLVATVLLIQSPSHAYAATSIPWDATMEKLVSAIQAIARPIVAIMVAVSGMMVMLGTTEGAMKLAIRITLGVGLALQVADFITGNNSMFSALVNVTSGAATKPTAPTINFSGSDKGMNFIGDFMTYYEQMCAYGAAMLMPSALKMLGWLTVIEMTMTLAFRLEGDHIKYILHQIIKVGFFVFLIQNWIGGTTSLANFANTIFTSFETLGLQAAGATDLQAQNILVNAYQTIASVWSSIADAGGKSIPVTIILIFCMIGIFISIVVTTLQLLLTRLEFWTIALIIVPMIPFGAFKHTRFLFERSVGAVFNLSIKMGVVSFISVLAAPMIKGFVSQIDANSFNIVLIFEILFGTLMLAVLSYTVPSLASGLFTGHPQLSNGDMFAPIKTAASAANTAASAAGAVREASNMAGGATALNNINKAGGAQSGWAVRQYGTLANLAAMANQKYNPIKRGYNDGQTNTHKRMSQNNFNSNRGKSNSDQEIRAGWKDNTQK
jgi:type IV secretion system protein TrbL